MDRHTTTAGLTELVTLAATRALAERAYGAQLERSTWAAHMIGVCRRLRDTGHHHAAHELSEAIYSVLITPPTTTSPP